jgi:rRNA maturation protein Nop10
MNFIHRVGIISNRIIQAELKNYGISVGDRGLEVFEVKESQESWPDMAKWIIKRDAFDMVRTEFSNNEISDADWLAINGNWHNGYPQPDEDNFGYRAVTYDLSNYCPSCGIGMKQCAPFRMKAEPKWGRRQVMQLNWVFDVFFVSPEFWAKVFQPFGIGCREVLKTNGQKLETIVQLVVEEEADIRTDGLTEEKCSTCGQVKYNFVTRGKSPALVSKPIVHMIKSTQYFGSGGAADKCVMISRKLAAALEGVRGAIMSPVAD